MTGRLVSRAASAGPRPPGRLSARADPLALVITGPLGASVAGWPGRPFLGGPGLGDGRVAVVPTSLVVVACLTVTRRDGEADWPVRVPADAEDAG